jgi:hypothetical protein
VSEQIIEYSKALRVCTSVRRSKRSRDITFIIYDYIRINCDLLSEFFRSSLEPFIAEHGPILADAFGRGAAGVPNVKVVYTGIATTPAMFSFCP